MFHTIRQGTLEYLTADALEGSIHCFSTRLGGVSEGALASLNLGTHRGDRPENVRENYRILGAAAGFAPAETVFTRQEHTDCLIRVGKADCGTGLLQYGTHGASKENNDSYTFDRAGKATVDRALNILPRSLQRNGQNQRCDQDTDCCIHLTFRDQKDHQNNGNCKNNKYIRC